MRETRSAITKTTLTALVLCIFAASPAAAIDPTEAELPRDGEREILLAPSDASPERADWLTGDSFHIAKKAGFGYTRKLKLGDRTYSFGVRGPVLRKQKAVGLRFRIRF